jgi:hypothetical protein
MFSTRLEMVADRPGVSFQSSWRCFLFIMFNEEHFFSFPVVSGVCSPMSAGVFSSDAVEAGKGKSLSVKKSADLRA